MHDTPYDIIKHVIDTTDFVPEWRRTILRQLGKSGAGEFEFMLKDLLKAKKYTLSERFIRHAYDISIDRMAKLPYFLAAGKPSYQEMFINDDTELRIAHGSQKLNVDLTGDNGTATKTGYLLHDIPDDGVVIILPIAVLDPKKKGKKPQVFPLPFNYVYSYVGGLPESVLYSAVRFSRLVFGQPNVVLTPGAEDERDIVNFALIGLQNSHYAPKEVLEAVRLLKNRVAMMPTVFTPSLKEEARDFGKVMRALVADISGDLRYLLVVMALLSDVPMTEVVEVDRGRTKTVGRSSKKEPHTVVHLNLIDVRRTYPATTKHLADKLVHQNRVRWHTVRGHWMYFRRETACDGQCDFPAEFNKTETCAHCGVKRTWRDAFAKGDPKLGKVETEYKV